MASTVSIRRSLLTNLILVIVLMSLGITLMMALSSRRAVEELSASLIQQASRRTEIKLEGFFQPVERQIDAIRRWGESGLVDLGDTASLTALLLPLMREFPWSSAVLVADEEGRELLLRRLDGGWSSRRIWRDGWDDRAIVHRWSDGQPVVESEESVDYDPRTRPWFRGAVELLEAARGDGAPAVYWTEPYRFFTSGKPGFTAAIGYRNADGRIEVAAIDITLLELSQFTSQIRLLEDSTVFVLTEDGRMIGVPKPPREPLPLWEFEPMILKRPEELGTTAAEDAARRVIEDRSTWGRPTRLVSDGEPWWVQITPYALTGDQTLLIGVAVGERAILGQIRQQRLWVAGITALVLALGIWRAVRLARGYSRPIEELVAESERIATGNLEKRAPIVSRLSEVQLLADAHDSMRAGLKTLLKLERDLETARQIQQSTLPDSLPSLPGIEISAWNQPADETGGDSFDVIGLGRDPASGATVLTDGEVGRVVLMLADATGHGIGPALSVTQLRAMLRMAVRLSADLNTVAGHVNHQLWSDLPTGRFITAWVGLLQTPGAVLHTFSAGQAPLLHYRAALDHFEVLDSDTVPLGLFPSLEFRRREPIELEPGDLFLVLSDGFFEAKSPDGEEMGTERICEVVREHRRESARIVEEQIRSATEVFTEEAPLDDDRTILVIKRV